MINAFHANPYPKNKHEKIQAIRSGLSTRAFGKDLYILLLLIILIGLFVFRDFFFLKKVYLFKDIGSDSVNFFYPQLINLADYIRTSGMPLWSFNQGLGQSIFPSIHPNNLFGFLFLLPKNYIAYSIFFVEFIKILSAGILFYLYLRMLPLSRLSSIAGGLLFAYSGYVILGSCWSVFSTEAVAAALLLYSFERFFLKKEWALLPLAVALLGICQPFYLYIYAIFLSIYAVFRFFEEGNPQHKKIVPLFLKLAGSGLLGIAIGGIFILSSVSQILQSPRGGEASYFKLFSSQHAFGFAPYLQYVTDILRVFSNDMMGTGSAFKGWGNYLEAPVLYCGLISLLLLPQVFIFLNNKRKSLYLAIILLCVFPLIFPYFRRLFWLFTGDYFRSFSFLVSIFMLIFSLHSLSYIEERSKVNVMLLAATLIFLLATLFFPYPYGQMFINTKVQLLAAAFLTAYAVLIYFMRNPWTRRIARILILIALCAELSYFSYITVNERSVVTARELSQKRGYNDYTLDAVSYLDSNDKSFFRICKYYSSGPAIHRSLNDGMAQGYKGISSYNPFNQRYYIKFLSALGIIDPSDEIATRWACGLESRIIPQTVLSVKYALTKDKDAKITNFGYRLLNKTGDVYIFRNDFYLPLGFTYDAFIPMHDFKKLSNVEKDIALLKACVVYKDDEKDIKGLNVIGAGDVKKEFGIGEYGKCADKLREEALSISAQGQNFIKGKIGVSRKKMLFLSIPYDDGWKVWVDGKRAIAKVVNMGFIGLPLDAGEHTVGLKYESPLLVPGAAISLAGILIYILLIRYSKRKKA